MIKRLFLCRTRLLYRTIDIAIQITYSPTAGGFKIAILASTHSTIAAGAPLYVLTKRLPFNYSEQKQSSTCVPNPATWPLLTPIYNPDVCSLNDERWELRGNELGCKVSTRTFLSVVVAVLGTVFLICAGWGVARVWGWSSIRWRGWMRDGRASFQQVTERIDGLIRGSFKSIFKRWKGQQKVMDERDG